MDESLIARLLSEVATSCWFSPSVFSVIASARRNIGSASSSLFWARSTPARLLSGLATFGWALPNAFLAIASARRNIGSASS